MQYEILGFNQEKVIEAELDITDLIILNYIIQANGDPTMEHIMRNDIAYVWIYHDRFLADLPILPISEGTLRNTLSTLKRRGFILSETLRLVKGSKTYYSISERTMSLRNDIRCHSGMTSDNISINGNIKNSNIVNNQQSLFTDNINKEELEVRKKAAQKFVDDYNSICKSLPKCQRLTPRRSKSIANILKKFSQEEILQVFNNFENSDFCKGNNDRGWRADIDFILREEKFVKALEGGYSNKQRCNVETISNNGPKYRVSAEEKEEMRRAVERGELKEY